MKELEEATLEAYKNEYWTRVITMENFQDAEFERYTIGPDMAEEVDQMERLDVEAMPELKPLFDPIKFQEEHKAPHLKDWMLGESAMAAWAEKVVTLRKQFDQKAKDMEGNDPPH